MPGFDGVNLAPEVDSDSDKSPLDRRSAVTKRFPAVRCKLRMACSGPEKSSLGARSCEDLVRTFFFDVTLAAFIAPNLTAGVSVLSAVRRPICPLARFRRRPEGLSGSTRLAHLGPATCSSSALLIEPESVPHRQAPQGTTTTTEILNFQPFKMGSITALASLLATRHTRICVEASCLECAARCVFHLGHGLLELLASLRQSDWQDLER
jgi:hypothetical protein